MADTRVRVDPNPEARVGGVSFAQGNAPDAVDAAVSGLRDISKSILDNAASRQKAINQNKKFMLTEQAKQDEEKRGALQYTDHLRAAHNINKEFNSWLDGGERQPGEITVEKRRLQLKLQSDLLSLNTDDLTVDEIRGAFADAQSFLVDNSSMMESITGDGVMVYAPVEGTTQWISGKTSIEQTLESLEASYPTQVNDTRRLQEAGETTAAGVAFVRLTELVKSDQETERSIAETNLTLKELQLTAAQGAVDVTELRLEEFSKVRDKTVERFTNLLSEVELGNIAGDIANQTLVTAYNDSIIDNAALIGLKPSERDPLEKHAQALGQTLVEMGEAIKSKDTRRVTELKAKYEIRLYGMKNKWSNEQILEYETATDMYAMGQASLVMETLRSSGVGSKDIYAAQMYMDNSANNAELFQGRFIDKLNAEPTDDTPLLAIDGLGALLTDAAKFNATNPAVGVPTMTLQDYMITMDDYISTRAFNEMLSNDRFTKNARALLTGMRTFINKTSQKKGLFGTSKTVSPMKKLYGEISQDFSIDPLEKLSSLLKFKGKLENK